MSNQKTDPQILRLNTMPLPDLRKDLVMPESLADIASEMPGGLGSI